MRAQKRESGRQTVGHNLELIASSTGQAKQWPVLDGIARVYDRFARYLYFRATGRAISFWRRTVFELGRAHA